MKINGKDLLHGLTNAVVAAVVISLYKLVTQEGFDILAIDLASLGKTALNAAFIVFVSSIATSFGIDKNGKFLGVAKIK